MSVGSAEAWSLAGGVTRLGPDRRRRRGGRRRTRAARTGGGERPWEDCHAPPTARGEDRHALHQLGDLVVLAHGHQIALAAASDGGVGWHQEARRVLKLAAASPSHGLAPAFVDAVPLLGGRLVRHLLRVIDLVVVARHVDLVPPLALLLLNLDDVAGVPANVPGLSVGYRYEGTDPHFVFDGQWGGRRAVHVRQQQGLACWHVVPSLAGQLDGDASFRAIWLPRRQWGRAELHPPGWRRARRGSWRRAPASPPPLASTASLWPPCRARAAPRAPYFAPLTLALWLGLFFNRTGETPSGCSGGSK